MSQANDVSLEELETRYKTLTQRGNILSQDKVRVEAAQAENKRTLKNIMEECKKNNWDPNTIQEDIRRAKEVLSLKIDNYETDLNAADIILKPMLKEIELL